MNSLKSSALLYDRACRTIPGGVSRNTVFRKPHPNYTAAVSGSTITDIDGNDRTDFANNMASLIHGHAHPEVLKAVTEQMAKGTAYTLASEIEINFAELLCSRAESFERIRFMNSGTEAVMAMIKAARAYTGRPKIAKAEGAYHGTYDFAEVSQSASPSTWGDLDAPNSVRHVNGTPANVLNDVLIFPFNDIERTLKILDSQAENLACVLIDPVPHRIGMMPASNEFIEAVYNWTRQNGALMVFDEVVTFRVTYGGAQQRYSVYPDLTALGKIIGGGFPVGALVGRENVMNVLNPREANLRFPHSGTFSANPITMTAGYTAMKLFDDEAVDSLNNLTNDAVEEIRQIIKKVDVPVSITGAGSMFRMHLRSVMPTQYRETFQTPEISQLVKKLLDYMYYEEKIIMVNTFSCMFSTALLADDIEKLVNGLERAFSVFKPEIHKIQDLN